MSYSDIQIDIINLTNELNYLLTGGIGHSSMKEQDTENKIMQLEAELQHWIDIS